MKAKDLLTQLTELEAYLASFSFEQLSFEEATLLRNSFEYFKNQLEEKFFKASETRATSSSPSFSKNRRLQPGMDDYVLQPRSASSAYLKLTRKIPQMKNKNTWPSAINEPTISPSKKKLVDLTTLFDDCMGKVDFLQELITLYKQNVLEFIGKVRLSLNNRDAEGVEFAAHKMKYGLSVINAVELQAIVEQMHQCSVSEKDFKHLRFLFDCFVNEYPATEKAIDAELSRLGIL